MANPIIINTQHALRDACAAGVAQKDVTTPSAYTIESRFELIHILHHVVFDKIATVTDQQLLLAYKMLNSGKSKSDVYKMFTSKESIILK